MTYTKQTWANGIGGGTPLNADRLNHIEEGLDNIYSPWDIQSWTTDGATDDTAAWNLAMIAAQGTQLVISARDAHYRISSQVSIYPGTTVVFEAGAVVDMVTDAAVGQTFVFKLLGDNISIINPVIDGSQLTGNITHPTGNRYIFTAVGTSKADPIRRPQIINPILTNFTQSDGNPPTSNYLVWHAFYFVHTENAVITGGDVSELSGHGCYFSGNENIKVLYTHLHDTGWGGVTLHDDNSNWEVAYCKFTGDLATARNWAAGVDDMSQCSPYHPPNTHGHSHHNYFSGKYSYGAVQRFAGSYVDCHDNIYEDCIVENIGSPLFLNNNLVFVLARAIQTASFTATVTNGSATISNLTIGINAISVGHSYIVDFPAVGTVTPVQSVNTVAGTVTLTAPWTAASGTAPFTFAAYQEPARHINIHDEIMIAKGAGQRAFTVSGRTTYGIGDTNLPLEDVHIHDNTAVSVDANNWFAMGGYVNGQGSGVVDCVIENNRGTIHPATTAAPGTASPIPGAVGFLGSSAAPLVRAKAINNTYVYFSTGPAATTDAQPGVYIGANVPAAEVRDNTLVAFYDGIFAANNSGSHYGLYANTILSSVRPTSPTGVHLEGTAATLTEVHGDMTTSIITDRAQTGPRLTFGPASLKADPRTYDRVAFSFQRVVSQAADITNWLHENGADKFMRVNGNGHLILRQFAGNTPIAGELVTSEMVLWLDDTIGATKIKFIAKDSAGTTRTGEIALS